MPKAFRTVTRGKFHLIGDSPNVSICGQQRKFPARYDAERTGIERDVCRACYSGLTRTYSEAKARRQTTRDANGRYSEIYKCENCNKRPAVYWSDEFDGSVCEVCSKLFDREDTVKELTSKDVIEYKPQVYGFRHPLRLLGIAIERGDFHSWHRAVSLIIQNGFSKGYPTGYKWYGQFGIYVVAYNRIRVAADKLDLTITLHHDMITIAWVFRGKADVFFIRRVSVQQAMDALEEPSRYEPKPEDFEPTWRAKLALDED